MYLYNITLMLNRASESRRLTTEGHGPAVMQVLEHIADKHAKVYAFMIMPDHIHLLFGRDKPLADVDKFAGRVKRRINKAFERRDMHKLSWIDGCVSYPVTQEGLAAARDYILRNPVRGLMVQRPEDWPYKGTPTPL
jgi:REP element-mobilizing transposase RayT